MERKEIIKLEEVTFGYGKEDFLKDITLPIYEDDFLGIIGPNGGGKTTLLKLILGLLEPKRGKISVFGKSPKKARHSVGYLSQFSKAMADSVAEEVGAVVVSIDPLSKDYLSNLRSVATTVSESLNK